MRQTVTGLHQLPEELIQQIISYLPDPPDPGDGGPEPVTTLKNLSVTCRSLHLSAFPIMFSNIRVRVSLPKQELPPWDIEPLRSQRGFLESRKLRERVRKFILDVTFQSMITKTISNQPMPSSY